jgi:hypothetical protein
MAAPTPFRSNSNAVMVRLMLVPSQWMGPEILQKWLKPEIGFYEPARLELHNCHEVLQIGTATIVRIASLENGWTRDCR